jgi:hypothetical protein
MKAWNELGNDDIPVQACVTINCLLKENETHQTPTRQSAPYSKDISPETILAPLYTSECEIMFKYEDPLR